MRLCPQAVFCAALLVLAGCDTPLISVTHATITPTEPSAHAVEAPVAAYPHAAPVYAAPPPDPYHQGYPQEYYAPHISQRPDYHVVADRNGKIFYCFKPTTPVQTEEKGKKFLGMNTVNYKIRCRHPRTGTLTDAVDNIVPLAPPY